MENENKKDKPPVHGKGKTSMRNRMIAIMIAAVLVLGAAAGSTLAWLTDKTDPVTNTFTVGNIEIKLEETTGTQYQMVPGHTITKNPLITVKKGSEKCYLFVELREDLGKWATYTSTNSTADRYTFRELLWYDVVDSWKPLVDENNDGYADNGVYWLEVDTPENDFQIGVLKENTIKVSYEITETMMDAQGSNPTLTVSAYAIQYAKSESTNFTPAEAWNIVSNTNSLS